MLPNTAAVNTSAACTAGLIAGRVTASAASTIPCLVKCIFQLCMHRKRAILAALMAVVGCLFIFRSLEVEMRFGILWQSGIVHLCDRKSEWFGCHCAPSRLSAY